MECDLLVLGAGPGGYPAAIRATQLGASVVCVEEKWVGGTCLNVGCIPTKAMVQSAHAWHDLNGQFKTLGVVADNASLDFDQVQKNRTTIVDNVVKGLGGLMKGVGIQMVSGRGSPASRASAASTPPGCSRSRSCRSAW
jgi:dihydrolipoamide dehydrogenase